jgi:hypothetical protein
MTRDFTKKEFRAAAQRNGFELGPFGLRAKHSVGQGETEFGYVFQPKPFKILRRVSLARAIKQRTEDRKHFS